MLFGCVWAVGVTLVWCFCLGFREVFGWGCCLVLCLVFRRYSFWCFHGFGLCGILVFGLLLMSWLLTSLHCTLVTGVVLLVKVGFRWLNLWWRCYIR